MYPEGNWKQKSTENHQNMNSSYFLKPQFMTQVCKFALHFDGCNSQIETTFCFHSWWWWGDNNCSYWFQGWCPDKSLCFSGVNLRWLTVQDCALTFKWCRLIPLVPGNRCGFSSRPVLAVPRSGSLRHRHAETPVDNQVRKPFLFMAADKKSHIRWIHECCFTVSAVVIVVRDSGCRHGLKYHWEIVVIVFL